MEITDYTGEAVATIVTTLIGFIIRAIEKRKMKKKATNG